MEKGPEFRVVGNAPEKAKEGTRDFLRGRLFENHLVDLPQELKKEIEKREHQKTPEQQALIAFANKESSALMERADVEPFDIPERNFHVLPDDLFETLASGKMSIAFTALREQAVLLREKCFQDDTFYFGIVSFHEILHAKARLGVEIWEDKNEKSNILWKTYRQGVETYSSEKKTEIEGSTRVHFTGLHEAIVASQEKAYWDKMLLLPELKQTKDWLESKEALEVKRNRLTKVHIPEKDILWVGEEEETFLSVSYPEQREVLRYIIEEIQKDNPKKYRSPDGVMGEFLRAHFSGKLLGIARLIEDSFGKGSFRKLGEMTENEESALVAEKYLRGARMNRNR